jgi:heme exporter protein A
MRLTAQDLGAERGGERVFSGIGFTLADGECLIVSGPNGAGKSTLLQVLCGLLPAAEGSVSIDPLTEEWPSVAAAAHYLGHQNAMKPALSVEANLSFWRRFNGEPCLEVDEALEEVGLAGVGPLPFSTLSTGQRRRAAIARLLVSWRPIWLLDEPTAGLDKRSEGRFTALMEAHRAQGGMIIAATHWPLGLEDVRELAMGGAA